MVVTKVADILIDESKWTKGKSARGNDGYPRLSLDEDAVCWCLLGAMRKAKGAPCGVRADRLIHEINAMGGWPITRYNGVAHFNDHEDTTFAMVQRVIKELDL